MDNIGVYLSVGPHAGGSYQYCLSIIDAIKDIKKKNFDTTFFIYDKKWKKNIPSNFKVIELKKNFFSERTVNFLKQVNLPIKIHKLFCSLLCKKIRIINNSDCSNIIFPSQEDECGNIKLKSITVIHDLMHRYERKFHEYNKNEYKKREINFQRICNFSDKVIVDSDIGKKHVIDSYNCKKNKILILPFTAPKYLLNSKIINIYKKYRIPKKKFIFYPAQFWEHKNHINLINAFNIINAKTQSLILILVGKEKNNLSNIKKEIQKYNLEKSVFILGYIDQSDLYTFYKKALMMCFVSLAGPTNIPPLEAMSLGCPLICSNAYGMPNQVGRGGLLVNAKSSEDIAKKIFTLLHNKELKKKIIKNGLKQYSKFNYKEFNTKFKKLFVK